MNNIVRKLTSRKLWLAIAGVVTGIALSLGVDGSEIKDIAGAVLTVLSSAVYIITEGKVDTANAGYIQEAEDDADSE